MPFFREVSIPMKKVPCCACKQERDRCEVCKQGFLEMTMAGQVPLFMEVEVAEVPESGLPSLKLKFCSHQVIQLF